MSKIETVIFFDCDRFFLLDNETSLLVISPYAYPTFTPERNFIDIFVVGNRHLRYFVNLDTYIVWNSHAFLILPGSRLDERKKSTEVAFSRTLSRNFIALNMPSAFVRTTRSRRASVKKIHEFPLPFFLRFDQIPPRSAKFVTNVLQVGFVDPESAGIKRAEFSIR